MELPNDKRKNRPPYDNIDRNSRHILCFQQCRLK